MANLQETVRVSTTRQSPGAFCVREGKNSSCPGVLMDLDYFLNSNIVFEMHIYAVNNCTIQQSKGES